MFPNGNIGLEYSKFYEDVPARGHLIGRAATGSCRKSTLPNESPTEIRAELQTFEEKFIRPGRNEISPPHLTRCPIETRGLQIDNDADFVHHRRGSNQISDA